MTVTVIHFRQSRYKVHNHQMVLKVGDTPEEATKMIGKQVSWTSPAGTVITGKISALHGRNGNVRAIFAEKGLPGQALGQKLKVL